VLRTVDGHFGRSGMPNPGYEVFGGKNTACPRSNKRRPFNGLCKLDEGARSWVDAYRSFIIDFLRKHWGPSLDPALGDNLEAMIDDALPISFTLHEEVPQESWPDELLLSSFSSRMVGECRVMTLIVDMVRFQKTVAISFSKSIFSKDTSRAAMSWAGWLLKSCEESFLDGGVWGSLDGAVDVLWRHPTNESNEKLELWNIRADVTEVHKLMYSPRNI